MTIEMSNRRPLRLAESHQENGAKTGHTARRAL
jgi:hypothetical protein